MSERAVDTANPRSPLSALLERAAATQAALELVLSAQERVAARVEGWSSGTLSVGGIEPGAAPTAPAALRATVYIEGRAWAFDADAVPSPSGLLVQNARRLRSAQRRVSARIAAPPGATVLFAHGDRVLRRPLVDLGATGLGVVFTGEPEEPTAGAALGQLRFSLPLGAAIVATAVVRHVRERGGRKVAGRDLIGLADADARRLDAWVRGQTRTRKRDAATRALELFAAAKAVIVDGSGGIRPRAVLDVSGHGVVVRLTPEDRALDDGHTLRRLELWHHGELLVAGTGELTQVVRHRTRPMQAHAVWKGLRPAALQPVERLLRELGR